eukprot:GEMP01002923.1.p1 GENE.GEMP01002923.1~~GEMP01002923.1.p1  ORF type:complete len:540 (+),score=109.93 GEMP01002923.1:2295-3914(+)
MEEQKEVENGVSAKIKASPEEENGVPARRKVEPDVLDGTMDDATLSCTNVDPDVAERLDKVMGAEDEGEDVITRTDLDELWKASAFTYHDLVCKYATSSPPLCVDFVPDSEDRWNMAIIFGTQKNDAGKGCLFLIDLNFNLTADNFDAILSENRTIPWQHFSDGAEGIGFGPTVADSHCIKVLMKFEETGDINRCKASRIGQFAATLSEQGVVSLYDLHSQKHLWSVEAHKEEGFALEWIDHDSFATGANDGVVLVWNVHDPSKRRVVMKRDKPVNDIAITVAGLIAIAGDEGCFLCDPRTSAVEEISCPPSNCVDCIRWKDEDEKLLFGGIDNVIRTFSVKALKTPLREYKVKVQCNEAELRQVRWCPFQPSLFSVCCDESIQIWNENQAPGGAEHERARKDEMKLKALLKEEEDFPTEVLFAYGGHNKIVLDVTWSDTDWYIKASVGLDGLHIWQMSTAFYTDDLEAESDMEPQPARSAAASESAVASHDARPLLRTNEAPSSVNDAQKAGNIAADEHEPPAKSEDEPLAKRAKGDD